MPTLNDASRCFQAGDLQESERICRRILAASPHDSGTLCLLGLIYHRAGATGDACELLRQSINADPANELALFNYGIVLLQAGKTGEAIKAFQEVLRLRFDNPETYFNIGNAFLQQGLPDQAIGYYREAVKFKPDYADAHCNLGIAYKNIQAYDQALVSFQQALKQNPNDSDVLFNLALILHVQGHLELAIIVYQKTVAIRPDHLVAWNNLAIALRDRERHHEAIAAANQALRLCPEDTKALNTLGLSLQDTGRIEEAAAAFRKAIANQPETPEAYSNLGNILQDKEEFAEAIQVYTQAVTLSPSFYKAWYNLGKCHSLLNDLPNTIRMYEKAIELEPSLPAAHWNLSHALLLAGEYQRGFQEYLWRWRREGATPLEIPRPEWQGESLAGRTILVHTEQGLGDSFQFIRYLPLVKERGGRVILACEQSLVKLLSALPALDGILLKAEIGREMDRIDCHVPLLNLPTIFNTTLETIPEQGRFIQPDPELVHRYAPLLAAGDGSLKVGIVWQGNTRHHNDRNRSCRPNDFSSLLQTDGTTFYSLQKGNSTPVPALVTDLAPYLHDFADTAAFISLLDLVISVDTSVAHLAGTMGRPTWVLLPYVPDWRWMLGRTDTPWYPTMRLFRQPARRDWRSVFAAVGRELRHLLNEPNLNP